MTWLGANSEPSDIVLSSHLTGSFIPAWAGNRVVIGHWAETIHFEEKTDAVLRFFTGDTPMEARRALLQLYGIRYLYHGPNERNLGDYDPSSDPLWALVFQNEQISLYRSTLRY